MKGLPHAPDFQYDWEGLRQTRLSALFDEMANTDQNPAWHAEGDVWTHTRMVCEALAQMPEFRALPLRQQEELALAALLHDVGKIRKTRLEDGVLVSPGHSAAGAQRVRGVLWRDLELCGNPDRQGFRETVCQLIRHHGLPPRMLDRNDPALRVRSVAAAGELVPDFNIKLLCMLAKADVLGRVAPDREAMLEEVQLCEALAEECGCLNGPYGFASGFTERGYLSGRKVSPEQELFDDSWGEVILMCGLPGVGKDTWLQRTRPELPVVSLDAIRMGLNVRPTDEQGRVVQLARERAREYLRRREPFAWDATCLTSILRQKQISMFEKYHASVRIVYLETDWQENLRRNAQRAACVPEHVIDRMLDQLEPPERAEARRVEWICV